MHERGHPLDEPLEVLVEALDLPRLHPEHRVAVLTNPRERDEPSRLALELLVVLGVVVLVVAVVVAVIVLVLGHRAASLAPPRAGRPAHPPMPVDCRPSSTPLASRAITAVGPTPFCRSDLLMRYPKAT